MLLIVVFAISVLIFFIQTENQEVKLNKENTIGEFLISQ